jgi:hypothetical protein
LEKAEEEGSLTMETENCSDEEGSLIEQDNSYSSGLSEDESKQDDFRTLPMNYLPIDTTSIKVGIVMRYIDWLIRSSSDATSAVTKKNLYDSVRMTMVSDLQHICSYARKIIKNEFIFGSQVLSIKTRS